MSEELHELVAKGVNAAFLKISKCDPYYRKIYAEHIEKVNEEVLAALAEKPAERPTGLHPTYYVRHPDETYSVADPQPVAERPQLSAEQVRETFAAWWNTQPGAPTPQMHAWLMEAFRAGAALLTGEAEKVLPAPKLSERISGQFPHTTAVAGPLVNQMRPSYHCGNCGADLSKHPVSAGPHICSGAAKEKS